MAEDLGRVLFEGAELVWVCDFREDGLEEVHGANAEVVDVSAAVG